MLCHQLMVPQEMARMHLFVLDINTRRLKIVTRKPVLKLLLAGGISNRCLSSSKWLLLVAASLTGWQHSLGSTPSSRGEERGVGTLVLGQLT